MNGALMKSRWKVRRSPSGSTSTNIRGRARCIRSLWKGTIYDLPFAFPGGMEDIGQLVNLVAVMVKRGHREADVRGVLGENCVRLFSATLRS
jgi:microsomal dipeptidase-like Zn-dependent dipeptidase